MFGLLIALTVMVGLGLLLIGFLVLAAVLLLDRTRYIIPMLSQIDAIEAALVNDMGMSNEPLLGPGVFRSIDGKHTASSLEELWDKMNKDSSNPKGNDTSDLDKLFNGDVDDDDEDEPDEKWKK